MGGDCTAVNRSTGVVAATVTITSTIGGLVLAEKVNSLLLMVLAIITPVMGLLWLDHARNIGEIGEFIRTNWKWEPNWEQQNAKRKGSNAGRWRLIFFILAVAIVFLVPAIAGLSASACHLDALGFVVTWGGAAALTGLFAISLAIQAWQSWAPSSQRTVV